MVSTASSESSDSRVGRPHHGKRRRYTSWSSASPSESPYYSPPSSSHRHHGRRSLSRSLSSHSSSGGDYSDGYRRGDSTTRRSISPETSHSRMREGLLSRPASPPPEKILCPCKLCKGRVEQTRDRSFSHVGNHGRFDPRTDEVLRLSTSMSLLLDLYLMFVYA